MELDTGSAIAVIPIRTYKQLCFTIRYLKQTQHSRQAGIINVKVTYESQEQNLDLFVVKNDSPALFGRSWLKLDWNSVKLLNTCKSTEEQL